MRRFDYRVPRFPVHLPVRLTFEGETGLGVCTEISTEGMALDCRMPLAADTYGKVRVEFEDLSLSLCFRVAHSGLTSDGLRFVYESDDQKDDVARFVSLVAGKNRTDIASMTRLH